MENPAIGKRYSFIDLFKSHDYDIEIPIIQRDYAQGRNSQKEVRDSFLEALKEYLHAGLPNRDLDFVYGYSYKEVSNNKFIPLDGQQRLTTLFLLHWYLANISGNLEILCQSLLKNNKSRFTYKTRSSSTDFCDALLINDIITTALLPSDKNKNNAFSNTIKNKSWFFNSWNSDPTVQSMLVMLDAIHYEFEAHPSFFDSLLDENIPIITFLYLDLKTLQQSDDLYIKMNSRGKPLTEFENFKAKFEQLIAALFDDENADYILLMDCKSVKVKLKQYFSFKIDTVWSNLFWKYRKLVITNPNSYDDEMLNFIRVIVSNNYVVNNSKETENIDLLFKNESVSFQKYMRMNILTKEAVISLVKSFDSLTNGNERIKNLLKETFYFDEEEVFKKALTNTLSYPERVLFFAYVEYLNTYPSNPEGLEDWMRLIHNLVESTRIDTIEPGINALKAVNNLLPFATNIIAYLVSDQCKIDFFFSGQIKEEKIKARLFTKAPKWKELIVNYESKIFHKGQIAYLLEFAGIIAEWEASNDLNWTPIQEKLFIDSFRNYMEKSAYIFSILEIPQSYNYYLERAVLTKGNYLIPASNSKYNFSSSKNIQNYERDFSWKRLLRVDPSDESVNNEITWLQRRNYLKELFDDERIGLTDIQKDLNSIAKDFADDWRKNFIMEPRLIQYCKKGFIQAQSFSNIKLLNASQINHLWSDMMTYKLYLELDDNCEKITPFKLLIVEGKGTLDRSVCHLYDFIHHRINYIVQIDFVFDTSTENGKYRLVFKKSKGENKLDLYGPEVVNIVSEQKLKWNEANKYFGLESKSKNSLKQSLYKVCNAFNELE